MIKGDTGSFASRNETISITATAGTLYDLNNLNLSQFAVCKNLAQFFQYYRISSVRWRLRPNFDTYVAPALGASNPTAPYLYFLFDKAGSLGNALSFPQLEECGAIPQRVDEKICYRRWKPSVLQSSAEAGMTGQFKTAPWLPTYDVTGTTLNTPSHLGAVWAVSKTNPSDNQVYTHIHNLS